MLPSPNWPDPLRPQHLTPPPVVRAQVWSRPAEIACTPLPRSTTSTGVGRLVVLPSPNWPDPLRPQHLTPPPTVSEQVCPPPAAMACMPLARPTTSTGVLRLVVVPSPNWPDPLPPQHLTPPPMVSAQVCPSPAAMACMPLARPTTSTGVSRLVVLPSPNWPAPLPPQHLTPPPRLSREHRSGKW